MTKIEKLARLKNYRTRYELAIHNTEGQSYLIAYCESKRRQTILSAVNKRALKLVKLTGHDEITFAKKSKDGAVMGDWSIVWTGRTQRDAICENELTWVGTLPE